MQNDMMIFLTHVQMGGFFLLDFLIYKTMFFISML
jgi:hypothetical protein